MRFHAFIAPAAFLFAVNLSMGSAVAEDTHAAGPAELQAAIAVHANVEAAQREAVQTLLTRPEVQRIVASMGLDLEKAQASAAQLGGDELQRLAAQATAADTQLAGGDGTVVIATSTVLIVLLVVILLLAM